MEKYHVLVVEDDTEIANAIKIYLENQGYDVYVGNDGLEGLEIIEKEDVYKRQGQECKHGDMLSGLILIGRGLDRKGKRA